MNYHELLSSIFDKIDLNFVWEEGVKQLKLNTIKVTQVIDELKDNSST